MISGVARGTKVPVSIVLYIDKTFMRRGIPIRLVYCKISYMISHIGCLPRLTEYVTNFSQALGGANWREPEGWSCIPL